VLLSRAPPLASSNDLLPNGRRHLFETTANFRGAFPRRRWRRLF
jgi:hypothetical protein